MYIILKLVSENFSRITVKISFLWGPKHGVYAAASFSANVTLWCSRTDAQIFTSIILYMNIIFIVQWLFHGNSEILHCSNVFAHHQKLCKPENIFKQTRVNFCYRKNMTSFLNYVTATLRALFVWRGSHISCFERNIWDRKMYSVKAVLYFMCIKIRSFTRCTWPKENAYLFWGQNV